ncbi:MAG: hypothetical protein HY429_03465 [Candidatus Levybacteria bacterium]|nr:hypothetical protein [Candidatus Levybacteria bacterium]
MATKLHYAVLRTKMLLRALVFLILGGILLFFLLQLALSLKERYFKTPETPPTVTFGKLPKVTFPKNASEVQFAYTVDTLSGLLPQFPTQTIVYKGVKNTPGLLDLQKATDKANKAGFTNKPVALSQTKYQWTTQEGTLSKKLVLNIVDPYVSLTSNYLSNPEMFSDEKNLSPEEAVTAAKDFFVSLGVFPQDLDEAKTKTTKKNSFIRVDFFQKPIQDIAIYYNKPGQSLLYAIVAKPSFTPELVEANFSYLPLSNEAATYPIKTAKEALSQLQKGIGYIASYDGNKTSIPIQNVFLGYYAADSNQQFLMPIIVFEGQNGFTAYVSAVRNDWIE